MAKTPCKGVRKDGKPCRGNGQAKYGGYCIGHAPAELTAPWRKRGGENASNAARAEKRMPDRIRIALDAIEDGLTAVRNGELDHAAFRAICYGAKVTFDGYRLANEEMEYLRIEESDALAREIAGAHGDTAILEAAGEISARQDRYTTESLMLQGLVMLERPAGEDGPAQYVLTERGRRRLGLQQLTTCSQEDLDQITEVLSRPKILREKWNAAVKTLAEMRLATQEAIADFETGGPEPVLDPLTGAVLAGPPAGVRTGPLNPAKPASAKAAARILKDQLRKVERLIRTFEVRGEDDLYDHPMDLDLKPPMEE